MTSHDSSIPVIALSGVGRVFHTDDVSTHALADIDLEVHAGEFVSISGPSGSGKSTLLALLGLLDTPSSGSYQLRGRSVAGLDAEERTRLRAHEIGFVFQAFNLIGDLTVQENVELPLSYQGLSAADRRLRAVEALDKVGMSHRRRHWPAQLSGGQQQRVAVARAIAGKPALLLADEPTGNLDSTNADTVIELLSQLHREGATICMVTHNPEFARLAERDLHLFDGRLVPHGAAAELSR